MNTVFILCCLILPTLAHHLSAEETAFLKKVQLACQDDPKTLIVDEELSKKLPENKDNPQLAIHMFCMSKKVGLQKFNGDLNKAVIKDKISLVTHDRSAIDGLVEKCAVAKETPEKTALSLWLCFVQNNIHYYPYDFWSNGA